jgi:putative transcriptional regulator
MSITRHLDDATLMSLAAGTLTPALAVVAASHVAWCPACRQGLAAAEALGAALLADGTRADRSRAAADAASRARCGAPAAQPRGIAKRVAGVALAGRSPADAVRWRPLGIGICITVSRCMVRHGRVAPHTYLGRTRPAGARAQRRRADAGAARSYQDETGQFRVGDAADLDESIEHRPVADPEAGCICVLAFERLPASRVCCRAPQPLTGL